MLCQGRWAKPDHEWICMEEGSTDRLQQSRQAYNNQRISPKQLKLSFTMKLCNQVPPGTSRPGRTFQCTVKLCNHQAARRQHIAHWQCSRSSAGVHSQPRRVFAGAHDHPHVGLPAAHCTAGRGTTARRFRQCTSSCIRMPRCKLYAWPAPKTPQFRQ